MWPGRKVPPYMNSLDSVGHLLYKEISDCVRIPSSIFIQKQIHTGILRDWLKSRKGTLWEVWNPFIFGDLDAFTIADSPT
jgi:hypothetical protein